MKRCPICQSVAFDDAATCYGCLHEFNPADGDRPDAKSFSRAAVPAEAPPAFVIKIKPERDGSGQVSWTCTVDLVPA